METAVTSSLYARPGRFPHLGHGWVFLGRVLLKETPVSASLYLFLLMSLAAITEDDFVGVVFWAWIVSLFIKFN